METRWGAKLHEPSAPRAPFAGILPFIQEDELGALRGKGVLRHHIVRKEPTAKKTSQTRSRRPRTRTRTPRRGNRKKKIRRLSQRNTTRGTRETGRKSQEWETGRGVTVAPCARHSAL